MFKYANSSSNYYVIMMLQNLKKKQQLKTRKFPIFLAFPKDKMPTQSKQQTAKRLLFAQDTS